MRKKEGKLGLWTSVAVIIGGMIGSAIFSLSGLTIFNAGPAVIVTWFIAAFVMLGYGLVCTELSTRFPESGGVFVFPVRALASESNPDSGKIWGWISTWGHINTNVVAIAFSAIYVGTYLSVSFPFFKNMQIALAVISILIVLALNYIRFSVVGKINSIFVSFLVVTLMIFSLSAYTSGDWDYHLFVPFFSQGAMGNGGFLAMVPTAMIAYGSIVAVAFMGGEIRNPQRNIPLSAIISIIIVLVVYLSVIVAVTGMISVEFLKENEGMKLIPLYAVAWEKMSMHKWLPVIISLGAFFALMTTMLIVLSMTSRTLQSSAQMGVLPSCLAEKNRNGVPFYASLVIAVSSIIISCFPQATEVIVNFAVIFSLITICINCISLIVVRRKNPDVRGVFRVPGGVFTPYAVLIVLVICNIPSIISGGWKVWAFTLGWYAVGLLYYFNRGNNKNNKVILSGVAEHGKGKGKTVGMPTVNLKFDRRQTLPKYGVYATVVEIDGIKYYAVTNVGTRPSVDDSSEVTVETHILDFDRDVYGEKICIEFVSYIRPIIKFDSLEEVRNQVQNDIVTARGILNEVLLKKNK